MHEITHIPTSTSDQADGSRANVLRAQDWFGEPFIHPDEDPAVALAPGTARRAALDDAMAEIEAGRRRPSARWKVRYGLMLGLERILSSVTPTTASGTELRRHQVDALAGMLTELIAANQRDGDEPENGGNGTSATAEVEAEGEIEDEDDVDAGFMDEDAELEPGFHGDDPGAARRFRFRHPTASGKTIAASGFVEASRHLGVLILTHRRLLVDQFRRDLTTEGYGDRFMPEILTGAEPLRDDPITIQTYAWFARHGGEISRDAYQLVICDEAHTALGEKTSAAIRQFHEPLYIGMTATEQLIAKQVSDVFPASVDDLPLADAARRGLIAPLRCLRVPPVAAINSVPIVGGDFEERALAAALDHVALNQAAASLYRERFGATPGIVYAAGVDHAYNLAQEFRAAGLKAMAVSGRTPPRELAETLAAYERGEINVLINAQLLAEGWNSPRATVCMHLAPTASRRVYQQRIGRIMRMHPRKEAGIVLDFVTKASPHNDRVVSLHSLLDADFYREGARVTPAPRRRSTRRARRRLSPAPWLVPVTPDVRRRLAVIQREWQRVDPKFLDTDEQRYWATIAGRQIRFDQRAEFARKFAEGRAGKEALETFLSVCAAENPNRRLRMTALADRVAVSVERADFDDLVTLVTQAPPWEKDRAAGVRVLLRALGDGKAKAPDQILARWTWRLARAVRKTLDRKASQEFPEAKRLLGAVANSRGHRHEENVQQLVKISRALPTAVGAALLASAEGYTPRANGVLDLAREELGEIVEIANALAESLPAPKAPVKKSRRRRRKKKGQVDGQGVENGTADGSTEVEDGESTETEPGYADEADAQEPDGEGDGDATAEAPRESPSRARRRRRKAAAAAAAGSADGSGPPADTGAATEAGDADAAAEAVGAAATDEPIATAAPEPDVEATADPESAAPPKPRRRRAASPKIHTPEAEPLAADPAPGAATPPLAADAVERPGEGTVPTKPVRPRRTRRKPAETEHPEPSTGGATPDPAAGA